MRVLREWLHRVFWNARRPPARPGTRAGASCHISSSPPRTHGAAARRRVRPRARPASGRRRVSNMDELRDQRGLPWLDDVTRDVRHALRMLRRSPGFAAVAMLVARARDRREHGDLQPDQHRPSQNATCRSIRRALFFVDNSGGKSGGTSGPPYPCFERLRDQNRFLSGISAFKETRFKVTIDGTPEETTRPVRVGQLLRSARRWRRAWPCADCDRRFRLWHWRPGRRRCSHQPQLLETAFRHGPARARQDGPCRNETGDDCRRDRARILRAAGRFAHRYHDADGAHRQ